MKVKQDRKIELLPGLTSKRLKIWSPKAGYYTLKMYKIPDQVIQFIKKTMQTWRVELTAEGKSLAEVKIIRGIFQGDAQSLLLYVIAMMPLNHTLRRCPAGYKLSKSQEKINHLMYMDDIKLFAINKKELGTLIQTVRI